jgi:hypothetical protein
MITVPAPAEIDQSLNLLDLLVKGDTLAEPDVYALGYCLNSSCLRYSCGILTIHAIGNTHAKATLAKFNFINLVFKLINDFVVK